MAFFVELKRRNVIRVAIAYVLAAWVLLQGVDFILDVIDAPHWIIQVLALVAAAGVPLALVCAWVFELTPEGLKRESQIDRSRSITAQTGRKLDRAIIVFLALAVVVLLADRFLHPSRGVEAPAAVATQAASGTASVAGATVATKSVAVLPFQPLSSGADDEYFADGLTEEILNALAQLPELLVTARASAFHFKGPDLPIPEIARQLGVQHIVDGSVRRVGERLRVSARLIRASDGINLWSQSYDRTSADTIAVQEDIAEKIAAAMDVVIDDDKRGAMRRAGLRDVDAFIALQKGQELYDKAHGMDDIIGMLRQANEYLDIVERRVPSYPFAYQLHSDLYGHILFNHAVALMSGSVTAQDLADAMAHLQGDYHQAVTHARTPEERNNAELDLAFLTPDWRGMRARIERFSAERGCADPNWVDNIAVPFGFGAQIAPRMREFRTCDPLLSTKWMSEARAVLWSGDVQGALDVARQGAGVAPGDWLYLQMVYALAALGQYDAADEEISIGMQTESIAYLARMMLSATQDRKEEGAAFFEKYLASQSANRLGQVAWYAWTGDAANANRVAAEIDADILAGPALATVVLWCNCGAPWNLSATPKFAALVRDAGFDWPPASPIRFPLKSW